MAECISCRKGRYCFVIPLLQFCVAWEREPRRCIGRCVQYIPAQRIEVLKKIWKMMYKDLYILWYWDFKTAATTTTKNPSSLKYKNSLTGVVKLLKYFFKIWPSFQNVKCINGINQNQFYWNTIMKNYLMVY